MTNKLTYPGLKCVLEYLEANRRMYIAARSLALRRIEKSIPIHLKFVMYGYDIELNDIEVTVFDNQVIFKRGEKEYRRQYPMDLEHEKAVEVLNEYYLGGRMNIYADHFYFSPRNVKNFPKLNVTTNELTVYEHTLNDILQYINPNSFPLKEMTIDCLSDLKHPHIRSAKKLCVVISDDQSIEYSDAINAIQNKNGSSGIGKETGTTLVCYGDYGGWIDEIVTKLRNEFSEILSELTRVNDPFPNGTPGFSIPLTTSSKILVYQRGYDNYKQIVLKVVSSQTDDNTMEMEH